MSDKSGENSIVEKNADTRSSEDLLAMVRQLGGDPADMPFWEACRNNRFLLHRCGCCDRHYWPASRCIEHGDTAMAWVEVSGEGELYTYTVMHKVMSSAWKDKAPYVVGVVKLDQGPMFHTNVIECPPDQLQVGMRLQPLMLRQDNGMTVPVYRPR